MVNGGSGKCLDVRNGGTADGTPVQLYTCNGSGSQRWVILTSVTGDRNVFYNRQSEKCLDVSDSGAQQWAGGEHQPEPPAGCTPGGRLEHGCIER
ncbi:RICIN domain-containing protein [Streptomyces aureoversilis]|uniref:RICIN domain-containing protein n=1 Tax=Streptomyces aureoversilis TaxID=67277 RepID=A0ABW0A2K4_9ACTN